MQNNEKETPQWISYSVSRHCSSCALSEVGVLQEKSEPVGDVCTVLLQTTLINNDAAHQGPHNSPVCFVLYSFTTTTIYKQPSLFYSFPSGHHFADLTSSPENYSHIQHIPPAVFGNFHPWGIPQTLHSNLSTGSSSCYYIASLALGWPITVPFPHL